MIVNSGLVIRLGLGFQYLAQCLVHNRNPPEMPLIDMEALEICG